MPPFIKSFLCALSLLALTLLPARASFEFQSTQLIRFYPLSISGDNASMVTDLVIIPTNGPITWVGGNLTVTVASNFVSGQDHLGVRNNGFGATALSVENAGGSLNIKYGGVLFATAPGFPGGTNLSSGNTMVCTFQGSATTEAVQALCRNIIFNREGFTYGIYETNVLSEFPPCDIDIVLTDGAGFSADRDIELRFPKLVALRPVPPILYLLAGPGERTGEMVTFADFDSGAQLARIRNQLTYEVNVAGATLHEGAIPHTVYFEIPPVTNLFIEIDVSVTAAPRLKEALDGQQKNKVIISTDEQSRKKKICVYQNWLALCIARFFGDVPEDCSQIIISPRPDDFDVLGRIGASISLATYLSLESLMAKTSEGNRLIDLYREHSKEMSRIACINQTLIPQCQNLFISWQPFVSELLAGRGTNVITSSMVNELNNIWSQFIPHAGTNLQAVLIAERVRFNNFQDFTNKTFIQWAQMLAIPVPTNAYIHLSEPARTTNGHFTAQANYATGINYSLDYSLNMSNWFPVTSLNLVTNTNNFSIAITDTNPPVSGAFYRTVVTP